MLFNPYAEEIVIECPSGRRETFSVIGGLIFGGLMFLMPISMLLTWSSFRPARVRRAHLLRGAVLAMPVIHAIFLTELGITSLDICLGPVLSDWIPFIAMANLLAVLGFVWYWWWMFLQRYIGMPSAGTASLTMLVLSIILAFATAFIVEAVR